MHFCRECHSGYDHKICNVCCFKYCNICLDLNHHDDMIEHLEKMILSHVVDVYILTKEFTNL